MDPSQPAVEPTWFLKVFFSKTSFPLAVPYCTSESHFVDGILPKAEMSDARWAVDFVWENKTELFGSCFYEHFWRLFLHWHV